ncbi:hypothetical protein RHS01_05661 [Rhizoctonia solani]|uniref:Uncharacterized protein n=1 Tax=Rhizoctonia solani TaxID=456999 RepID=A0A8H7IC38_9AGAM|nr:hypothetical protein RHS01_05661 [Rhizoctonia solani]
MDSQDHARITIPYGSPDIEGLSPPADYHELLEEKLLAHHHGSQDGGPHPGVTRSRASSFTPESLKTDHMVPEFERLNLASPSDEQARKEGVARSRFGYMEIFLRLI